MVAAPPISFIRQMYPLCVLCKVDIAEPEAVSLLQLMDLDRDGVVSVDDFMVRFPPVKPISSGRNNVTLTFPHDVTPRVHPNGCSPRK